MRVPTLAVDDAVDLNLRAAQFVENQVIAFDEESVPRGAETAVAGDGARLGKGLQGPQPLDDVADQSLRRLRAASGLSSAT